MRVRDAPDARREIADNRSNDRGNESLVFEVSEDAPPLAMRDVQIHRPNDRLVADDSGDYAWLFFSIRRFARVRTRSASLYSGRTYPCGKRICSG